MNGVPDSRTVVEREDLASTAHGFQAHLDIKPRKGSGSLPAYLFLS